MPFGRMESVVLVVALYSVFLFHPCDAQRVNIKLYAHNRSYPEVIPNSLNLSPGLTKDLGLRVPADFNQVVLQNRYTFRKPGLLIKALLHADYKTKDRLLRMDSFAPLDAIGNMVLDYMITRTLIMNSQGNLINNVLSDMRIALLHQNTIAFIAVKNKLDNYFFIEQKHIASGTPLAKFKAQVNNITEYQALVTRIPHYKSRQSPGAFVAPMMKALIGAVHVDTGYDIQKTDDVIMPMFKRELDEVYTKAFNNLKVF